MTRKEQDQHSLAGEGTEEILSEPTGEELTEAAEELAKLEEKDSFDIPPDAEGTVAYMNFVRKIPLLTLEEETRLSLMTQKGDIEARNRLICANLRLPVWMASKYIRRGCSHPFWDLVQAGNIGLIRAAARHNPEKGRFSTYAYYCVRTEITIEVFEPHYSMGIRREELLPLKSIIERLTQKLGRQPTLEETALVWHEEQEEEKIRAGKSIPLKTPAQLAAELQKTQWRIQTMLTASQPALSLETPLTKDSEGTLSDIVEDQGQATENDTVKAILAKALEEVLEDLPSREQRVIRLLFWGDGKGGDCSLAGVGKKLGLSRERVRQIEEKALRKLRRHSRGSKLKGFLE